MIAIIQPILKVNAKSQFDWLLCSNSPQKKNNYKTWNTFSTHKKKQTEKLHGTMSPCFVLRYFASRRIFVPVNFVKGSRDFSPTPQKNKGILPAGTTILQHLLATGTFLSKMTFPNFTFLGAPHRSYCTCCWRVPTFHS